MRVNEKEILDKVLDTLKELKAVPRVQMDMYIEELTGATEEEVRQTIDKYGRQHIYLLTEYGLQLTGQHQLNRKTAMGMWAYMFLNDPVGEDYRLAKWPATLLFRKADDENLYRVTVCDNPEYDRDLAALKEMKDDRACVNVIVGEGFDAKDINPDILPDSSFIYLRFDGNALMECPACKAIKVKFKEE